MRADINKYVAAGFVAFNSNPTTNTCGIQVGPTGDMFVDVLNPGAATVLDVTSKMVAYPGGFMPCEAYWTTELDVPVGWLCYFYDCYDTITTCGGMLRCQSVAEEDVAGEELVMIAFKGTKELNPSTTSAKLGGSGGTASSCHA